MGDLVNIVEAFEQQVDTNPNGIAVKVPVKGGLKPFLNYQDLTWRELSRQVHALASYFKQHQGVMVGSRVLVLLRPGQMLIAVIYALFKLGAVPIIIDPGMGLKPFLECVKRSRPDALVGISKALWVRRLFKKAFDCVKTTLALAPGSYARLVGLCADQKVDTFQGPPSALAAVVFTSGSTGPAKGVCYEHGMLLAQLRMLKDNYGLSPRGVDLPLLPVFSLFNPALGVTTVVPPVNPKKPARLNPEKVVRVIVDEGVTQSFGSPLLWRLIVDYAFEKRITLNELRHVFIAGASVSHALMKDLSKVVPNAQIIAPYGATEVLPVAGITAEEVICLHESGNVRGRGTCIGYPLKGVEVAIIAITKEPITDFKKATVLEKNQVGEIVVCGPSVTHLYDRMPEATHRAKMYNDSKIWHRMGDLGYTDEQGRLWFCGRLVERVKTPQGYLYTDCVESWVSEHPKVLRVALIQYNKGGLRARAAIVIELKKPHRKEAKEVKKEIWESIKEAPWSVHIEAIISVAKMPVDVRHNAKIHRLSLSKSLS